MPRQSSFTQPLDTSNVYAGYQKASQYNPVDKSVLVNALKPYKLTLTSSAGLSDQAIRNKAAKAVVAKYLAAKAAAARAK